MTPGHRFKTLYQRLRGMKTEIEHTQHLLHMAKVKVQQEFEVWWQSRVTKVTVLDDVILCNECGIAGGRGW